MKVGFTGTQQGMTAEQRLSFAKLLQSLNATEFHHGDCIGADAQAHQIAAEILHIPSVHIWPPLANVKRAFCKSPVVTLHAAAGYLERNWSIVKATDILIGCPKLQGKEEQRSGTWATIREARRRHKQVIIVWPDGSYAAERSEPEPAAVPAPKLTPGPVIFKIREVRRPISQEVIGYRVLVGVPNMDGHEPFSTLPAPSFAKKYLIYESSDFGETEVRVQLKRVLAHLMKAGYTKIQYHEEYAEEMRQRSAYNLNESQHKIALTPEQKAQVDDDPLASHMKSKQHPFVW